MKSLNKFFISSTPFTLTSPPYSPANKKSSNFHPGSRRTHRVHLTPKAHNDNGSKIASKKTITLPPNATTITSTSNPFVKHCVKIRQSSSYRHFYGYVLVVGATPIREICSFHKAVSDRPIIECLFVLDNYFIPEEIDDNDVRVIHVNLEVIKKLSGVQSVDSVEVIALVRIPSTFHIATDKGFGGLFSLPHRILVLDGIQDPGNLGTLVRSATAFRWDGVYLLPGCCDPFNDKALRASRGASFQIPIVSGNWQQINILRQEFRMKMFAGHPSNELVTGLSKEFADSVANSPLCLILGSEGGGLSEDSMRACELVSIPMAGDFESLNVSVAGGIFMYMLQNRNK
ncbi:hypothetical protein ABFS82_08G218800 [Erythranthe guttata]|uniref:rRNA methyltransferase 3, mitochondrial n=1 Tax=Erythranthe guttata TaxID=4155 RepID=UPI00064E0EC8|nr:PREDICTED: rRNA methyltransferase 3, mitochondrial [Erythranthe guttata]|eukprot:XP_012844982.1 PREDICTED: rRNA methyltransferase 3, mitochondrial [Erythranthe guttata]